jgi:hypothetical protein
MLDPGLVPLGEVNLGVETLGVVSLGVLTFGTLTDGVVTTGVLTFGVVTFGVVTLGVVTTGAVSVGALTLGSSVCVVGSVAAVPVVPTGRFSAGAVAPAGKSMPAVAKANVAAIRLPWAIPATPIPRSTRSETRFRANPQGARSPPARAMRLYAVLRGA